MTRLPEIRVKPLGGAGVEEPYAYVVELESPGEVPWWRVLYQTEDARDAHLFMAQVLVTMRAGAREAG